MGVFVREASIFVFFKKVSIFNCLNVSSFSNLTKISKFLKIVSKSARCAECISPSPRSVLGGSEK